MFRTTSNSTQQTIAPPRVLRGTRQPLPPPPRRSWKTGPTVQWLVAVLFVALALSTSVYLILKRLGIEPDLTETIMLGSGAILAGLGFVYALASETDQAAVASWNAEIKHVLVFSNDLTFDEANFLLANPKLAGWTRALPKKQPALQYEAEMLDKRVRLDLTCKTGSGRLTIEPRLAPSSCIYPAP